MIAEIQERLGAIDRLAEAPDVGVELIQRLTALETRVNELPRLDPREVTDLFERLQRVERRLEKLQGLGQSGEDLVRR